MKRRTILKGILGAIFSTLGLSANAREIKHKNIRHEATDIVLDQSGSFGNGAFVIGVLSCKDAWSSSIQMARIRYTTHFRCALSHSSRNKWKERYARKVIDLWLRHKDMSIDLLVDRDSARTSKLSPSEKLSNYTELVSRLVDNSPNTRGKQVRLVTQTHFKSERQTRFENMLSRRNAHVQQMVHVTEHESSLLQLVDLVVGAVQASQKATLDQISNPMKIRLTKYLMNRLGVDSFEKELRHPRCSIKFV